MDGGEESLDSLRQLCYAQKDHMRAVEDENLSLRDDLEECQIAGANVLQKLQEKHNEYTAVSESLKRVQQAHQMSLQSCEHRILRILEDKSAALEESHHRFLAAVNEKERAQLALGYEQQRSRELVDACEQSAHRLEDADRAIETLSWRLAQVEAAAAHKLGYDGHNPMQSAQPGRQQRAADTLDSVVRNISPILDARLGQGQGQTN